MHFEGDLTEDKGTESNILAEGSEWFAKGLWDLKQGEHGVSEESVGVATFHGLTFALSALVYEQNSVRRSGP